VRSTTITDDLASGMLAHGGAAAISDLHLAAAAAKCAGKLDIAASLLDIAEAAERLWLARLPAEVGLEARRVKPGLSTAEL